jgi:TetR/AcrR family transcriptional repressor of nem operon
MKPLPTTERGRRSRMAIVSAAAKLMHERGLAAPSMDDVLAASGAGKSQLYHYFGGRQDLRVAVLHHQFDLVMAAQPALRDQTCDDIRCWRDEVLAVHRSSNLGTCPLGAFVGQTDVDPVLQNTLAGLFARWQDAVSGLVARAQHAGRVDPDTDPATAALSLLTALQGGIMLAHLRRDPAPLRDSLDAAMRPLLVRITR